jgi:O-methyltransferase
MGELITEVRPYSLVPDARLRRLGEQVWWLAVDERVEGAFVECGVWKGGAAFLMARVLQEAGLRERRVWLLDSFEGLSPPTPPDGDDVAGRWSDRDPARNYDYLAVPEREVRETARSLGVEAMCEIRAGWFAESLPRVAAEIGPIALLRIDCDLYEPVMQCLVALFDQVSEGGMVVFDDYYSFPGCAIAVHEFLGTRRHPHRLVARPELWLAWLRKGELA